MKNTIKCTNCGSTGFKRKVYYTEEQLEAGNFSLQGVHTYVCQRCGHVEFFDADFDAYSKELCEIAKKEKEKKIKELDNEISEKKSKLTSLNEIINNLDSTQREVRTAKSELPKLQEEINKLELQRSSIV